jgi:HTH-type transcriptional regulator, competence development regulator
MPDARKRHPKLTLGAILRNARQEVGVGLKTAAPRLGVDYTYLSKIENGVVTPSAELLSRMAKYYNADSDSLFTAADRLPPDVEEILRSNKEDVIDILRKRFGRGSRQR